MKNEGKHNTCDIYHVEDARVSKEELPPEWQVASGCEQLLNCEHQFGAQHIINGNTPED